MWISFFPQCTVTLFVYPPRLKASSYHYALLGCLALGLGTILAYIFFENFEKTPQDISNVSSAQQDEALGIH
jgi:hypothetical protein